MCSRLSTRRCASSPRVDDGHRVDRGGHVADISGHARSILSGERTALNLLGRMSGVATATAQLVEAVDGTGARISDTRKTMPGLRALDKYAVRIGGGMNHRFGLYDAVLIKDNHLVAAGDIAAAVAAARAKVRPGVMIEVEVVTLEQLAQVLQTDADRVLLDNMGPETLRQAVEMTEGRDHWRRRAASRSRMPASWPRPASTSSRWDGSHIRRRSSTSHSISCDSRLGDNLATR